MSLFIPHWGHLPGYSSIDGAKRSNKISELEGNEEITMTKIYIYIFSVFTYVSAFAGLSF